MVYQIALSVAVFVELNEEQKQELFGDGGYREDNEERNSGLFHTAKVEKATLEASIKRNYSIQKLTYREVMDLWQKKRV